MFESLPGDVSRPRHQLEESRGGWAFFGRMLVWSTRNNGGTA
ncbi:MAG TPA: hypothetical protein VF548_06530 [Allosphingosinicella sp.]|jgi:hypothetical protein